MATGYNLAEGGADGVVPTTGNTGGASGDPASTVAIAADGSTIQFATAAAKFGSLGYRFTLPAAGTAATRIMWAQATSSRHVFSVYWSIDSVPTATEDLLHIRHSSGHMCAVQIGADGKLIAANRLGTSIAASKATNAILANTLYRTDIVVKPGTGAGPASTDGTIGYAYFAVATSDSSAVFSYESAVQDTGINSTAQGCIGRTTGRTQAHVIDYDCVRWDTLASGFMPAFTPPAVNADAGFDITTVEPGSTVALDGTASTGAVTTYAWTQVAGTTVTLTGASTATATFTAPNTYTGETLTFRLTVNGGDTDDVDVVTLPNTERIVSSVGVLTPTLMKLAVPAAPLADWYAALAARASAPAKIAVLGDSISEGVITTVPTYVNRWQGLLQSRLRTAFPVSGITPSVGYMPANYADSLIADETTKTGGAVDVLTQWGLGAKCVTVSPSQTVVWPAITCERIRVHYGKSNFLSGGGKVLVDGVDQGVTLSSVAASNSDGFVWDSGTLTLASHVITLQGNTSNRFFADGVEFYASAADAAAGVKVYDASHSGARTSTYLDALYDVGHWQAMATLKPHLYIVCLGVNDWGNLTPATYLANMTSLLGKMATANGATAYSVLICLPYKPVKTNGATDADWAAYKAGLQAMVGGNVAFMDWQDQWPALVSGGATNGGLMYETSTPTHPNAAGHNKLADMMVVAVSP